MKKIFYCGAAAMALAAASCASNGASAPATNVEWQLVSQQADSTGKVTYAHRFVVTGDVERLDRLAFNVFDRPMHATSQGDTIVKIIPGYYYIASGKFGQATDTVIIDMLTETPCYNVSFSPDGVHGVDKDGKPFDVNFTRARLTDNKAQWTAGKNDRMPYGDKLYAANEELATNEQLSAYDILPTFKSVKPAEGTYTGAAEGTTKTITHENPEFYRIIVAPEGITVEAASDNAAKMGWRAVKRLLAANNGSLPAAVVEDYPDYGYRGMMIDVARNYQPVEQMKKFLDAMADYRLNRLQFHFIDDEAWRLEIPGLPELTEIGARRGYTLDENDFLAQIYAGNGDPNAAEGTANGYMTRQDFIDFLKYATDLGITVIPEVETPGHARAAVKAMEARYRRTGDDTYRLREDGDTSVYRSAQDFTDNVINPALPGPYKLMDKVFDEIIAMYKEAGAPLEIMHIGGDEVPHGAWSGSPSAIKFMEENNIADEHAMHAYWVKEMADMLKNKGLKLAGWQEIAIGKPESVTSAIAPEVGFINIWMPWANSKGVLPSTEAQQLGIPALISAVTNYYFDLAYDWHPDERGLVWGGVVDEFKSFDGYPERIAPAAKDAKAEILGVQGQMWAETMRSPEWMEYYLFPKMFGLVERSWNADSTINHAKYNKIIDEREMPALEAKNINFRMRQPGIKLSEDGKILMNSPYPKGVIRYTLDGSEPSATSATYSGPVDPAGAKEVRARLYHHGKESVTTIQPLEK